MEKCALIGYRKELTITEYSLTTSTKVNYKIQKERTLHLVLRLRGETERQDARHQWQHDHQDPEYLPHSAHELQHVNDARFIPCAHCPLVRSWSSWFAHHIVAQAWLVRVISCPYMKWAFLFDFELSIPSNFLFFSFIFNLLHFLLHFFHNLEGSSNTAYFAWKEMDSTDESYFPTGYEPKNYDLMETCVESFTESMTHPQFSEQRLLEDVEYDDTALEDMLREAHRVHVYHSQREGLSVGQSSSTVSERTVWPVGERTGRLVGPIGQESNVANAQIRTLLDTQREQILAEWQAEIKKHEFQSN